MSQSTEKDPVFFWKEHEHPYGYLSQWYLASFTAPSLVPGEPDKKFSSAEKYMMYHKAMLFGDKETADQIMLATKPRKQQSLGRKVEGFIDEQWQANREKIVEEGNWYKFTNSERYADLGKKLLETGERPLVEASPFDRIWGVGFSARNAPQNKEQWGENLLGKALVRVRTPLREQRDQHEQMEHV